MDAQPHILAFDCCIHSCKGLIHTTVQQSVQRLMFRAVIGNYCSHGTAGGCATGCHDSMPQCRPLGLVEWLLSVCLTSSSSGGLTGACSSQDPRKGASWKVERVGASLVLGSELSYSRSSLCTACQGKSHDYSRGQGHLVEALHYYLNIKCPPRLIFGILGPPLVALFWETVETLRGKV